METTDNLFQVWEEASGSEDISTITLDLAVSKYVIARQEYEEAKAISSEKHGVMTEKEEEMLSLLERAGKSKYHVDGVGTVQTISKFVVQTPKSLEDKAALFKWLKDNLGVDGFLTYAGVNHQSLNKLYKDQFEVAENKATFNISGVGQPTERKELRFTKIKKETV